MYMRLGFAVAAHIDADVLLLDEVFAVGDEEFQRKCFAKIFEFKQRGGTIVYVSHDAASVERLCERAVLLREGKVEIDGSTQEALARYHRLLAEERDPEESAAGLNEYGSGEARITQARLLGPDRELDSARDWRRVSYQTCPDWPELMEIAPDLQFKHLTARQAQLPADALMQIPGLNMDEVWICCDPDRHVYFARHTDPQVVEAL